MGSEPRAGGVLQCGGTSDPDKFPCVEPRGGFYADAQKSARPFPTKVCSAQEQRKVALVAHSAAGWICRIYLSAEDYGGRAHQGCDKVSALVALGTPFAAAPGVAFENVGKAKRMAVDASLPTLAVCLVSFAVNHCTHCFISCRRSVAPWPMGSASDEGD
jgi:hypothetical protein